MGEHYIDGGGNIPVRSWKSPNPAEDIGIALTALRRICSLEEKNVPKYAQQIAKEALDRLHMSRQRQCDG